MRDHVDVGVDVVDNFEGVREGVFVELVRVGADGFDQRAVDVERDERLGQGSRLMMGGVRRQQKANFDERVRDGRRARGTDRTIASGEDLIARPRVVREWGVRCVKWRVPLGVPTQLCMRRL